MNNKLLKTSKQSDFHIKTILLGISWVTIIFEKNMQIFINKLLIPNRFLPSQSLNHFVWLCSGRNDAVY